MITGRKNYFRIISGALKENPVRAPGVITGGVLTGQRLLRSLWGVLGGISEVAP